MASIKEAKEAFVTDLEGTTSTELLIFILLPPIAQWFYQAGALLLPNALLEMIPLEIASFWVPMILCQSNMLYPFGLAYVAAQVVVAAVLWMGRTLATGRSSSDNLRTSLTIYRSSLLFLTFVAILAVDFHVFPRRFVKTETTGYALMDMGAASFVISGGFVSSRARGRPGSWRKGLERVAPLIFMGSLRLLTHKGLEYQEHVSEYGVHWNFFFTLAMLAPVTLLVPGPTLWVPLVLLVLYQVALSQFGGQAWIEEAPRSCLEVDHRLCHLFAANREGILGCIGYGALHLASEWIGYRFLWQNNEQPYSLLALGAALTAVWQGLVAIGIPASRRSTNAAFVTWILAMNLLQLGAIQVVVGSSQAPMVPPVTAALNRHGLFMFVLANLLTGAVNLSIDTLQVSDAGALGILLGYMTVIGVIALLLDAVLGKLQTRTDLEKKQE